MVKLTKAPLFPAGLSKLISICGAISLSVNLYTSIAVGFSIAVGLRNLIVAKGRFGSICVGSPPNAVLISWAVLRTCVSSSRLVI